MAHGTDALRVALGSVWGESRRRVLMLIAVLTAAALAVVVILSFSPQLQAANGQPPPASAITTAAAAPSSSPEPSAPEEPAAAEIADAPAIPAVAAPQRISYPGVGLDMEILPLTPSESEMTTQSLVPPLTEQAYWITSYGQPGDGSENTTYITGHSWEDRPAPFNRLSSDAEVGDTLNLVTGSGEISYVVDSVITHDKNTLKDSEIWNIVPNRLVLISCFTEDLWGKNVVVTASPAAPS